MSDLVTIERYVFHTRDSVSASADVEEALDAALELLEEELGGRPLLEAERAEVMYPDQNGRLYPAATPLVSVEGGWLIDGATILGASPFPFGSDFVSGVTSTTVTYRGGFVERTANPDAANALPLAVERDLAFAAYTMLHPSALAMASPAGASSVRLGDAAVTFKDKARAAGDQIEWSSRTLRLSRVGKRLPGPIRQFTSQGEV